MRRKLEYTVPLTLSLMMASVAGAQDKSLPDLSGWHDASQAAAKEMVDQYGQPDGVTDRMLIWYDNGPWKRTIIYKEAVLHRFPVEHPDVLEQTINYDVPVDLFDDLATYDGSVIAERTKGILSARCDKEAANFLAINLANDIVTGKRSVEEARTFYADTMKAVMNDKEPPSPDYVKGFVFEVPEGNINNPDEPMMSMASNESGGSQQMAEANSPETKKSDQGGVAEEVTYNAELTGAQEVPPVETAASGMADIVFDAESKTLSWKTEYSGLSGDVTAAHYHGPAPKGENAPPVVPIPLEDLAEGSATLTDEQAADLAAGLWYLNIHTAANTGGEIRGQVMAMAEQQAGSGQPSGTEQMAQSESSGSAAGQSSSSGSESVEVGGAPMFANKTIAENAANASNLSTLVAAVQAAGLVETLGSEGPFTVFAPDNAAFEKLPAGTVDTLLKPENKDQLIKILTYHVVPAKATAKAAMQMINDGGGEYNVTTVSGDTLTLKMNGDKLVIIDESGNGAAVTQADVMQSNGVAHVIDTVLMPK